MQEPSTLWWYSLVVPPSPPSAGSGPSDTPAEAAEVPHLDVEALGEMLRERRTASGLSMRRAADAARVSFMTLSRVERGAQPDLATFLRLCAWLRLPPETFFVSGAPRETETPEAVLQHLLADPRLERGAASRMVRSCETCTRPWQVSHRVPRLSPATCGRLPFYGPGSLVASAISCRTCRPSSANSKPKGRCEWRFHADSRRAPSESLSSFGRRPARIS